MKDARRIGRPSVSCDSPKSVYGKIQASAKSEHDRLARYRGSDDLQVVKLQSLDLADHMLNVLR